MFLFYTNAIIDWVSIETIESLQIIYVHRQLILNRDAFLVKQMAFIWHLAIAAASSVPVIF